MDATRLTHRAAWLLAGLLCCAVARAQNAAIAEDLLDLSMEDLMQVEVTTASRLSETRKQTPAAVTVLTQEDIRRSGATSIPEVLRMVPGIYVARLDANKWSVTARGFGGRFANKMQVQVDGVSIYSPLFSGTFWEAENVMLEDIDRIEVVRGPGGATWGANAVNGIINIITKPASETGSLVRVGTGTEDRARLGLRVSEQINEDLALRVSGQYLHRGEMELMQGGGAKDHYTAMDTQLRLDWNPADGPDDITFIARALHSEIHEIYVLADRLPPWSRHSHDISSLTQSNLYLQWSHELDNGGERRIRGYIDHWDNDAIIIDDRRHIADVEAQWRRPLGERAEMVYGGGIRHVWDNIGARYASFDPQRRSDTTFDLFSSIAYWVVPDKLRIVAGARAEVNDYTGFEIEPTLRATWMAAEHHTVWAAVSRGVRVTARGETDVFLPSIALPGTLAALVGNEGMGPESVLAAELGYRYTPRPDFAVEVAMFANHYDDLRSIELARPYLDFWQGLPTLVLPFESRNNLEADSAGGSIHVDWRPREWWRLRAYWAYFNVDLQPHFKGLDILSLPAANDAPRHELSLWNSFDITPKVTLDTLLQYTDRLDGLDVDDYFTANIRLGWRPREDLELSLVGHSLLESERLEYTSSLVNTVPAKIERGVYAEVSWQF